MNLKRAGLLLILIISLFGVSVTQNPFITYQTGPSHQGRG
jgi:hypothetical protein